MSDKKFDIDSNVLVGELDKMSYVIHSIFPFFGLKKKAIDLYYNEIEKSNLSPEVKFSAIYNLKLNYKHFNNLMEISEIAVKNAKPDTDFSKNSNINDEWLERYLDSAKYASEQQVKLIWGKILSKEFETPGSVPASIISVLPAVTSKYAELFGLICNMTVLVLNNDDNSGNYSQECIVPFGNNSEFFVNNRISFFALNELESLGLIKCHFSKDYILRCKGMQISCIYFDKKIVFGTEQGKEFPIGSIMLTETGKVIRNVIEQKQLDGYYDELVKYYKRKNIQLLEQ